MNRTFYKTGLLMLMFTLSFNKSTAQRKYSTIPETNYFKEWLILQMSAEGSVRNEGIAQWTMSPDTLIGIREYAVYQTINRNSEELSFNNYLFRDTFGVVYRYYEEDQSEYPVYDFLLSVGDVYKTHDGRWLKVVEKGVAGDFSPYWKEYCPDRVMLKLEEVNNPDNTDVWIEGVGSVYTGILSTNDFRNGKTYLQCVTNTANPQVSPDIAAFNICTDKFKSIVGVGERVTSPEEQQAYIDFEQGTNNYDMEFIDDTLHVSGFCILGGGMYAMRASVDRNIVSLSITGLSSRNYSMTVYKFDVKIPGFTPGTYTIKYYNRDDVVLECGKPLKGDVNEDGVVDINDVTSVINIMAGQ